MKLPRHPKAKNFHGLGLMVGVQSSPSLKRELQHCQPNKQEAQRSKFSPKRA